MKTMHPEFKPTNVNEGNGSKGFNYMLASEFSLAKRLPTQTGHPAGQYDRSPTTPSHIPLLSSTGCCHTELGTHQLSQSSL